MNKIKKCPIGEKKTHYREKKSSKSDLIFIKKD